MAEPLRVCFVCLGNICRSPTAEGIFRGLVERAGLAESILIDSAGTGAYHEGSPADARSRKHAERRGYQLDSIARQFKPADFTRFDYVLCMDQKNLRDVQALGPSSAVELRLFREFDATAPAGSSGPDPYYDGDAGFEEVLDQCERASAGLLEALGARLGCSP